MSTGISGATGAVTTKDEEKAARLAAALRENLKRRKGRERALDTSDTATPEPAADGLKR